MAPLRVDVVTPMKEVYGGPADEVMIPGFDGEFGVLPGHDALVAMLRGGTLTIRNGQEVHRWITGRGFAEVNAQEVTILVDSAEDPGTVDKQQAQADIQVAETEMFHASADTPEWEAAEEKRELAAARLSS
jgi:F-type H+-transporting ATPase subunit epsilon